MPLSHLRAVPDPPSLDDVYREHVDFVVRITRRLGVSAAHVEDVVHDVFLVVHRKLVHWPREASARSYLYGITKRVVFHHHRGVRRIGRREAQAPSPSEGLGPEEALARREAADVVEACLDALPPEQRMVLVLADIEEMTAPEVARAIGIKLNTVYSRLRLARRRLEDALATWREEEQAR